ncbi:MAG TPA: potassium-transporting ATPase subunit KdpA [Phycisphaerae bacterium]|nr:potassium-transporting ATPase subunit KdpA [Phycisphaerae bacterium]HRY70049.1 potassium-transporting ATPase subunit KdpA [Phycisphaerae bacterium]HSA27325.1 potassium-transporting ATPase subunit KdpA [Phycisphaerae bacterium]
MTTNGWLQIGLYTGLLLILVKPLGWYMTRVFNGEPTPLGRLLNPMERLIYHVCGVDASREQHWAAYAVGMLLFNLAGVLILYGIQRLQGLLWLNPQHMAAVPPDLAFNTAVSFTTNTNWQAYFGETTMSYLTQMVGLTVQNFVSAATGIALAIALVRGFARHSANSLGNFWVDLTRCVLYILVPLSVVLALLLVWQGVPQNLRPYLSATTLEGATQTIPQGPMASQEAIKQLGTNGGGFLNANCAHPYENPTPLANLLNMIAIFAIGAGLTNVFGRMVGDERQGWAILATMLLLFLAGVSVLYWAEAKGNPAFAVAGVATSASDLQAGGNMEGKETRFGIANSALFATATTDASCGAVNGMHGSFTPLGGMVPLVNILLGEIIIGGVGSGLYGMLIFAVLTVFIAGLMVGRTPECIGKKIEAKEVKMAILAVLVPPLSILCFSAIASVHPAGLKGPLNAGPHGFSEILYAFTSGTGNNGSAFAGLNANTPFYNLTIGLSMLIGRFVYIVPMLAVAGSLVAKRGVPASAGTFPTHGPMFVILLTGVILIVGGLTFFPALALGPIVEHLAMAAGKAF